MTRREVEEALRAKPFRPFRINLADGRELHVPHPEFLALHPAERTAVVFFPEGGSSTIDLILVTSIDKGPRRRKQPRA